MTETAVTISLKVPPKLLERIPAAGNGRSRFILSAMEEKLSRQKSLKWKPVSRRGRKLAALLKKGHAERHPLLNDEQFERELAERRGRQF